MTSPPFPNLSSLLDAFLGSLSSAGAEAQAEAQKLQHTIFGRHTHFAGDLSARHCGLMFGANAFLVNPVTQTAYDQLHDKAKRHLPLGGKVELTDEDDFIAVARREAHEECHLLPPLQVFADMPLLDVHFQPSTIPAHPGTWCFLTIGFWVPPDFILVGPGGRWRPLVDVARDDDVSNARCAEQSLWLLANLRAQRY